MNYFEILGVTPEATVPEIKRAYRKLAAQYHPDRTGREKETGHFIRITKAFRTLIDPVKRSAYQNRHGAAVTDDPKGVLRTYWDQMFREGLCRPVQPSGVPRYSPGNRTRIVP